VNQTLRQIQMILIEPILLRRPWRHTSRRRGQKAITKLRKSLTTWHGAIFQARNLFSDCVQLSH